MKEADADRVILALQAFDIMMRLHWYPCFLDGRWFVVDGQGDDVNSGLFNGHDDPFAALVEADKLFPDE